ncbi:microtubule-associated protein TORTIFOLIA1-like isoform X3 [Primulina tabacum]|uniref:microtubule-associated protein TORTIFOLIA1-like isoform X3 n=1 Tax=Primulina tabacum TaxID=48773 RepID=UPI003F591328
MSSQRSSKPTKPPNQTAPSRSSPASSSSSLSSHLAMVELKQRILTCLSKLADRDTHQIAVEDLEKIINGLSSDGISMLLNCLYDASNDPKPAVKKEGIRLLAVLCAVHTDPAATHLTKIIAHIVKKLKDTDSQVRDTCRDAIGSLAGLYLKGGNGGDGVVSLFVKPLFEVMSESNKTAQGAAAVCLAKMIECSADPPLVTFQKLCPRVCKHLNSLNFLAKASLLQVVSSLSQVGSITPQSLESLLPSIHECLGSSDWTTRKAAAEALISLSSNTSYITPEGAASTLNVLESCRFDKIKPARESITEALQILKKIAGKGDGSSDDNKTSSHEGDATDPSDRNDLPSHGDKGSKNSIKDPSSGLSPTDSSSKGKGNYISDKTVGMLKKKAPALTDKELNPEFFHNLETRGSDLNGNARLNLQAGDIRGKYGSMERGIAGERGNSSHQRESSNIYPDFSRNPGQSEGFMSSKGNWLVIQRQLLQLERQQGHLMNMLQDFMGSSHDSMVTLENRVRGIERVVEDMARELSVSSGRRGSSSMVGFEESSNRPLSRYNGFPDYSSGKLGRVNDGRSHFGERFTAFDNVSSGLKGRGSSWRSDVSDSWDFPAYGKNSQIGSRRAAGGGPTDFRISKTDNGADQPGSRIAWENGAGPIRFGEGPSARSVWQASKDEATLEAIRVAGEDNGVTRSARVAIPEMTAEALGDDDPVQERDPIWTSWSNAMDALLVGDMDSAFVDVLSTGDDLLLAKLMDKSGPVIDQLSNEVASEVLHAVAQFLLEQNLFDMCLYWIQQLADIVLEDGQDVPGIPIEVKMKILQNLQDCSSIDLPEDWEGPSTDQLLLQLASAWEIDLRNLNK